MTLLALETAYDICGAAVLSRNALHALEEVTAPRQHNERLAAQVETAMRTADLKLNQLEAIAVSCGPGSYTGLRIGMSYAKGLATGLGLPIMAVPTLASMAFGLEEEIDWIAAWSHRDLFYGAPVNRAGVGEIVNLSGDELREATAGKKMACHVGGWDGAPFESDIIAVCPSAEKVGKFALIKDMTPQSDIEGLVPEYFHNYQLN